MPHLKQVEELTGFFDKAFEGILRKIKGLNLTGIDIAQLSAQIDFLEELKSLGFDKEVNKYFANYDKELSLILTKAEKLGVRNISAVTVNELLLIKELDTRVLLGSAELWANTFEAEMIKGTIAGLSPKNIIANMEQIPLNTTQLNTVLNTSSAEFNRLTTKKAFEELPEQRFRYSGGLIPTSSDICTDLITNQRESGYTSTEIDAGISAGGGIVNWSGRIPNFNCIHSFEPI